MGFQLNPDIYKYAYNKKNTKYFIDYTNKVRECGHCGTIKPFSKFHGNSNGFPKTACKQCESSQRSEKSKLKRAAENPEAYNVCEICGGVWSKFRLNKECDKCRPGSKLEEEVKEGL